ncbi:MAG: hypothetical protein FWD35_03135 [Oscillospiraceae bacterium]|nr:hypothetical protein [Oscillospiraceae bacterium]
MMTISEKVAYVTGLAEGMKIDASTNEGKLALAMIDILKDIAEELDVIDETLDDMAEVVSELEEDLEELEDEIFGELDELGFGGFNIEGDELYEITCSECENTISVDMSMLDNGAINCPNCGERIEFGIDIIDTSDPSDEDFDDE